MACLFTGFLDCRSTQLLRLLSGHLPAFFKNQLFHQQEISYEAEEVDYKFQIARSGASCQDQFRTFAVNLRDLTCIFTKTSRQLLSLRILSGSR